MLRAVPVLALLTALTAQAGTVQLFPPLPNQAVSKALHVDAAGNIYVAGSFTPRNPIGTDDGSGAFVAKLSPDGSKLLYFTTLNGSFGEAASAIAIASDGSAYVVGYTYSSDFPVTPGALETTFDSATGASQGFLAKLDASGTVTYATYINGTAFTQLTGIALDTSNNVFLTGSGGPDYPASSGLPIQGFTLKLDPTLSKILLSTYGYGGGLIHLAPDGSIYLAGNAQPDQNSLPALSPNAFQSTHSAMLCEESIGPGGPFSQPCPYPYLAQLDVTGKLLWGTYVTGTYGAAIAGMGLDAAGNVIIAGTTNSTDFPVTDGAFQTLYSSAAPQFPGAGVVFLGPPNAIGFVAKVNSTGTELVWSTYFGGTYQDQITGMTVDPNGDVILSGRSSSSDLAGLEAVPAGCRPSPDQVLGFVARLTGDGTAVAATQPVYGAPDCRYTFCGDLAEYETGWPLALRTDGTVIVGGANGSVASVDFASRSRIACITDSADNAQINTVTPGQLVSLFGLDLGSSTAPLTISFDGVAAPVLYASAQQVNVQVPYEVSGASDVQMQIENPGIANPISETKTLDVAEQQPSIFLTTIALESLIPGWTACGGQMTFGQAALALNQDGTVNDCTNPAPVGSAVTVFLNGFGQVSPPLATGAIESSPAATLAVALIPGQDTGTKVIALDTVPGSISGVAQLQLQPGSALGPMLVDPTLAGVPFRERVIFIWAR